MDICGATRTPDGNFRLPNWIIELAERNSYSSELGRIEAIDEKVRLRGLQEISLGKCLSMARTLTTDEGPGFRITRESHDHGDIITAGEEISISCHGTGYTHIDGLNHFGALGCWFGGASYGAERESTWSISTWAQHGIITRCWLIDVPKHRSEPWVTAERPVTGDELQSIVNSERISIEPGDALLIYMGRERYEAEGNRYLPSALAPNGRPGLGPSAGQWIGRSPAAIVCWDFMDACGPEIGLFGVHLLIWAVGIALVDNCAIGEVRAAFDDADRKTGCLFISPLAIAEGTGSAVTPIVTY